MIEEESPNNTFVFDEYLGLTVYNDSTIIIDLNVVERCAKEEAEIDKSVSPTYDYKHHYDFALKSTIRHGFFHLLQFNPLYEEIIPSGEEAAEAFARGY